MKRLVLIMLLISAPLYAEFGIKTEYGQTLEQAHYVEILLKYRFYFGPFQNIVYGGFTNWLYFDYKEFHGYPVKDLYSVGNTFKYKSFYIDIKRFCTHSIPHKPKYRELNYMSQGAGTKFSAGFEHWF